MKKSMRWLFALLLLGLAGLGIYIWMQGPTYQPPLKQTLNAPPDEVTAPAPPAEAKAEPAIKYPVPEQESKKPLPPLARSDAAMLGGLAQVFGKSAVRQFFHPQEVARRLVATIDNLPRKVVSAQLMPTKSPGGTLRTERDGDKLVLSEANYSRYTPFIALAEKVDAKTFMTVYTHFYPLLQQAYREQGYPKGYFNDRLVQVIDHLLQAPEVDGPIVLVQPHVFYKFAEPELESLSAGHKLMLRIGVDNAARVQQKLREIRRELVKNAPKAQ